MSSNDELQRALRELVEAWCDRRCLGALRRLLPAYPMPTPLTDSWGELVVALEDVRAFARDELAEQELQKVNEVIVTMRQAMGWWGPATKR